MSDSKYYMILVLIAITTLIILAGLVYAGLWILDNTMMPAGNIETFQNTSIISLSDGDALSGHFFLGIGSISETPYFYYYEGRTAFKLKWVRAEYSTIIMDEESDPYISTITGMSISKNNHGETRITRDWTIPIRYEFHVPEGTLTKQFKLDGEL